MLDQVKSPENGESARKVSQRNNFNILKVKRRNRNRKGRIQVHQCQGNRLDEWKLIWFSKRKSLHWVSMLNKNKLGNKKLAISLGFEKLLITTIGVDCDSIKYQIWVWNKIDFYESVNYKIVLVVLYKRGNSRTVPERILKKFQGGSLTYRI